MNQIYGLNIDAVAGIVFGKRGHPVKKKSKGYVMVQHQEMGWLACHRLVWESVYGPIAEGLQVNHKNGIKHDNRLDNLEVVTPSGNLKHAYRTGLCCASHEKNGRALLSLADVLEIRSLQGIETLSDLSMRFHVKRRTIKAVLSRQTWAEA